MFRSNRAAVASYTIEPEERYPANAWLYACRDHDYGMEKLSPAARRNIRRGLKELRIDWLSADDLLEKGAAAFCDARERVGVSDGTPEQFQKRFSLQSRASGHVFLGAWKGETLVAFLSIVNVADWVDIEGCFSTNDHLRSRPNDTLMYTALRHYLVDGSARVVTYGMSSIQAESNKDTLHVFKTKVGFEAIPVHRAFARNPLLYPLFNRLTLAAINLLLRIKPDQIHLKKAGGVIAAMLGRAPTLHRVGQSQSKAESLARNVRTMRKTDLRSVATLHLAAFPNDILSRLGWRCVLAQYKWLLANYGDCNLVYDHDGEVVGFVTSGDRSYRPRMWRAIAPLVLFGLLRRPGLVLAIITERRNKLVADRPSARPATAPAGDSDSTPFDLRMVTIAVSRSYRKRGVAGTLLDEVAERAKRRNAPFMMSHTFEPDMMSVFDRHGWEVYVESESDGKLFREYRKYFRH